MGPAQRKYVRLVLIAGLVVLCDQISKTVVAAYLPLNHQIPIVDGFFNLTHIRNPGGAFGFMAGLDDAWRTVIFLVISSAAVGLVCYFYTKTPQSYSWLAAAFALIVGGAIGNLIDRFRFGMVIDFLDFYIGQWHWPAFNLADSAITVGVGIFGLHLLFKKMPE